MGGGGDFYDRDVTDRSYRTSSGATTVAAQALSKNSVDRSLLPKGRRLVCEARNPLVYAFDVTGSMDNLPQIIYDKWPGIVGQIVARKYLPDPQMSLAAVGDVTCDDAPLQMTDFSLLRNLDRHFKKIFLEGKGGSTSEESYEFTAYYYAYLCDMPKAENPICLFTADEGVRETLYGIDLREHFGGQHKDTNTKQVFVDLLEKFNGNVFLIHRYYRGGDEGIVEQWRRVLSQRRIIFLPKGNEGDLAIGDITLGVYAIVSGARTLEQYLEDMRTRPLDLGEGVKYEPQSPERIKLVEKALQPLKGFEPIKIVRSDTKTDNAPKSSAKKSSGPAKEKTKSWKL